jgi:HNH endonuclease/uncharacterized protein DUF1883
VTAGVGGHMSYLLYEMNVEQGQKVRVDLTGQASVRLLDPVNLRSLQAGAWYNYYPSQPAGTGVELSPPFAGLWYVVVDRGWFPITEKDVTVTVLPAPTNPWLVAGVILAVLAFVASLAAEEEPRRRHVTRPRNTEPLDRGKRLRVYVRDGGVCTYCGTAVAPGEFHVDHSVSRKNGGTNHLNNLRTACAPCNLSKGGLNARQFKIRA